jgi:hypothetical protein
MLLYHCAAGSQTTLMATALCYMAAAHTRTATRGGGAVPCAPRAVKHFADDQHGHVASHAVRHARYPLKCIAELVTKDCGRYQ